MERITDNVYAATDIRGCNPGYVVTSDGVVVIDPPQLPSRAVKMREEILKKGPIRYLINTEQHFDHVFGDLFFSGLCPVICHEDIVRHFWTVTTGADPYEYMMDLLKGYDPQEISWMPPKKDCIVHSPDIIFSERLTLRVGDHIFKLINTPGHTKGQTAVYVPKERVIFAGDTIFCECQTWFQSADPESWLRSLDLLRTLDFDYIIPGHGPICKKDYILKQSAFIREWITAVAVGISKGWSREECVERISFLDRFPMDIGLEKHGPRVQKINVEHLFDFLQGKTEGFK
jgi:cyclase